MPFITYTCLHKGMFGAFITRKTRALIKGMVAASLLEYWCTHYKACSIQGMLVTWNPGALTRRNCPLAHYNESWSPRYKEWQCTCYNPYWLAHFKEELVCSSQCMLASRHTSYWMSRHGRSFSAHIAYSLCAEFWHKMTNFLCSVDCSTG